MKAHIVGGGFAGLAAAALLIRNAGAPGQDITIYEADDKLGGGYFLEGDAESGYNLPGSVFDKEFRCAFDLLATIPTEAYPNISVAEQFFTFNNEHPFVDQTHIVDRELRPLRGPRYGLSLSDGLALARLSLTSEEKLDGRRIEEFFPKPFFDTEFWLLWSTIMGSLPQHSLIEFRRYMNRFVYLFPDLSRMAHVLRSQFNQHEAFVKPLVAWLRQRDVNFVTGVFVRDLGFDSSPGRLTVNRVDYERGGAAASIAVAPDDIVLVTTGSQAADISTGSMKAKPPPPPHPGRSWALWTSWRVSRLLAADLDGRGNLSWDARVRSLAASPREPGTPSDEVIVAAPGWPSGMAAKGHRGMGDILEPIFAALLDEIAIARPGRLAFLGRAVYDAIASDVLTTRVPGAASGIARVVRSPSKQTATLARRPRIADPRPDRMFERLSNWLKAVVLGAVLSRVWPHEANSGKESDEEATD